MRKNLNKSTLRASSQVREHMAVWISGSIIFWWSGGVKMPFSMPCAGRMYMHMFYSVAVAEFPSARPAPHIAKKWKLQMQNNENGQVGPGVLHPTQSHQYLSMWGVKLCRWPSNRSSQWTLIRVVNDCAWLSNIACLKSDLRNLTLCSGKDPCRLNGFLMPSQPRSPAFIENTTFLPYLIFLAR